MNLTNLSTALFNEHLVIKKKFFLLATEEFYFLKHADVPYVMLVLYYNNSKCKIKCVDDTNRNISNFFNSNEIIKNFTDRDPRSSHIVLNVFRLYRR